MEEEMVNASEGPGKDGPGRSLGFFGRLVVRLTGGRAARLAGQADSMVGGEPGRSAAAERGQAWEELLELPRRLEEQARTSESSADELREMLQASSMWARLAREEIGELRKASKKAVAAGWEPAGEIGSLVEAASVEVERGDGVAEYAAKLFALGWETDEPAAYRSDGSHSTGWEDGGANMMRWRACKLKPYSLEAPERLAALAIAARCARRVCEMSVGGGPIFVASSSGGDYSQRLGFAAQWGVWTKGDGVGLGGSSYGAAEPRRVHEPSLGLIASAFGAVSIQALRHGGLAAAEELAAMFAEHWRSNRGLGPQWAMPSTVASVGAPGSMEEGPAALSSKEKGAIEAGVPPWSVGVGAVPTGRWMAEDIKSRIEGAPKGYWGEGAEHWREAWANACAKEREDISQSSLSASHSDDPHCRSSEAADCRRRNALVDAQEALLDWLMRKELGLDDPWVASPACALRAAKALHGVEGQKAEVFHRGGVPGFKEAMGRLDGGLGAEPDVAEIGFLLAAWAEAREMSAIVPRASKGGTALRM